MFLFTNVCLSAHLLEALFLLFVLGFVMVDGDSL